jgi:hypothetical protein
MECLQLPLENFEPFKLARDTGADQLIKLLAELLLLSLLLLIFFAQSISNLHGCPPTQS